MADVVSSLSKPESDRIYLKLAPCRAVDRYGHSIIRPYVFIISADLAV